jgi:hypothetical protein
LKIGSYWGKKFLYKEWNINQLGLKEFLMTTAGRSWDKLNNNKININLQKNFV